MVEQMAIMNKIEIQNPAITISRSEDVAISLFSREQLCEKYPWLNTEGVALASNGRSCTEVSV